MNTRNIHEFRSVTDAVGINVSELGCVMLDVEPFNALEMLGPIANADDVYTSTNPEHWWIKGNVAAAERAHVTLLYGLLDKAWQPEMAAWIAELMDGWERPDVLVPTGFEVFESPFPDEPYGCVVAKLEPVDALDGTSLPEPFEFEEIA